MIEQSEQIQHFYLTDLIGTRVFSNDKKIGKLADLLIVENGKYPQVKNILVSRPFGDKSLIVPWANIVSFSKAEIVVSLGEDTHSYEKEPDESMVLLNDQILDKKIIDTKDKDVEVVYDIRLQFKENRLYVSDVDLSKYRMLQRMGLKTVAKFFQYIAGKMRDQRVSWEYIQHLPKEIGGFKGDLRLKILKEKLTELHPIDLATIIEELNDDQRAEILETIDIKLASEVLQKSGPNVQRDIVATMPFEKITELLSHMTVGQISDVLSSLPHTQVHEIIKTFDEQKAHKVIKLMEKQEGDIQDLATSEIITCLPTMKAGDAQGQYQKLAKGKDVTMYIYVVDEENHLLGVLDIKELLLANNDKLLQDIMINNIITLTSHSTYTDAFEMFSRYNFRAIPVCDKQKILFGAITYKDLMGLKHRFID